MMNRGVGSDIWVQADQKQIIIAQLKDELYLLRKNQQDYIILQDQLGQLERRYRILEEERSLMDSDFRAKHEVALRTISQLKAQTDALRADLRERNLELEDLDANGSTLKNQLDQRNIEIERLKNDTNSILDDYDEMMQEKHRLDSQLAGLKADKATLLQSLKNLEGDNDNTKKRINELEKYLTGLEMQSKSLRDKIMKYQNQNNNIDGDINDIDGEIEELNKATGDTLGRIKQLQHQIAGVQTENDKAKSTALHLQKAQQAQYFKNTDLAKTLIQAENALRNREVQIVQGQQDIDTLLIECDKVGGLNGQLNNDMENLSRHLENLGVQNSHVLVVIIQLLLELERYSSEDQTVRNLLDRKPRVLRARMRVEESQAISRGSVLAPLNHSTVLHRSLKMSSI